MNTKIYCPNCLNETEIKRLCAHCRFQLSAISPFIEAAQSYFELAKQASRNRDYAAAAEHLRNAFEAYPYVPEHLRYGILFFHFTGDFNRAFACLKKLDQIEQPHTHSHYHEILRDSVDRYNAMLQAVKNGEIDAVIQQHLSSLHTLSLVELQLLKLAAESSQNENHHHIESVLGKRAPVQDSSAQQHATEKKAGKAIPVLLSSIVVVTVAALIVQHIYFSDTIERSSANSASQLDSLANRVSSISATNMELRQAFDSEKRVYELTYLLDKSARSNQPDSVLRYFDEITAISPWRASQHWRFLEKMAYDFYVEGFRSRAANNYSEAAIYFYRSYRIAPGYWRSPHALLWACQSAMMLNDRGAAFSFYFREFVQNYSRFRGLRGWTTEYERDFAQHLGSLFEKFSASVAAPQDSLRQWLRDEQAYTEIKNIVMR